VIEKKATAMNFCFSVDDVCFEGYSSEEHLARLLDFLRETNVRGTFFVVPLAQGVPLTKRRRYVELLKMAIAEGHEIGQHGLEHDRFEFGIPPKMILDLEHEKPARDRLAHERKAILDNLTIAKIRARLAKGRRILEDALGIEIVTFRGPCLSICDNLFHALEAEGFAYDSSRYLQEAGWDILNGKKDVKPRAITRAGFEKFQYPGKLVTLPLTTEYTWYLQDIMFEPTWRLARHDLEACLRAAIPFVQLCHISPIFQGQGDNGLKFYRRMFDFARELCGSGPLRFSTIKEAGAAIKAGLRR